MRVEPLEPRYTAGNTANGIRATIPAVRNWFGIVFMSVWMCGWTFGFVFAIRSLTSDSSKEPIGFLVIWLVGWTLGGTCVLFYLLWQLFGREVIEITDEALVRRIQICGVGTTREYALADVTNLRALPLPGYGKRTIRTRGVPIGLIHGSIEFDYGTRRVQLGELLDAAETKRLLALLTPFTRKAARNS